MSLFSKQFLIPFFNNLVFYSFLILFCVSVFVLPLMSKLIFIFISDLVSLVLFSTEASETICRPHEERLSS